MVDAGATKHLVWCIHEICEERTDISVQHVTNFGVNDTLSANSFIVRDHLGSIVARTDDNVNVQARAEYEPFGGIYRVAAMSGSSSSVATRPCQIGT